MNCAGRVVLFGLPVFSESLTIRVPSWLLQGARWPQRSISARCVSLTSAVRVVSDRAPALNHLLERPHKVVRGLDRASAFLEQSAHQLCERAECRGR